MGKKSTRLNKNKYQILREELNLTREEASELLDTLSADRIEKIESGKVSPRPEEVLEMSEGYHRPELCNHYCVKECPIGEVFVSEVPVKELSQITLEMLSALNSLNRNKNRLIDITADGEISDEEIDDFAMIQKELDKISIAVEALHLWAKRQGKD